MFFFENRLGFSKQCTPKWTPIASHVPKKLVQLPPLPPKSGSKCAPYPQKVGAIASPASKGWMQWPTLPQSEPQKVGAIAPPVARKWVQLRRMPPKGRCNCPRCGCSCPGAGTIASPASKAGSAREVREKLLGMSATILGVP